MNEKEIGELLQWDADHILHPVFPVGQNAGLIVESAEGVVLRDLRGKEYIDTGSQLTCVNLGYGQQEIVDAAMKQMRRLQYNTLFGGRSNLPIIDCSRRLAELTPKGLDYFIFTSGGSESTETAYRLARLYWNRKGSPKYKIISLYHSYHGMNFGSLSATGLGGGFFSKGVGPLNQGFLHIPSYHCYRCMLHLTYPDCGIACARFLEETIVNEGPDTVAAFIAEPEHGTAGMIPPPPEYWPMVRKICDNHDVLLIADEVMTGFGRTGRMFAVQHWDVIPDIMALAKGITSAYLPFGATAMNGKVREGLKGAVIPGYTYCGHPVCAAAAAKTMEIYVRDRVVEHAAEVGKYTMERLNSEFRSLPCVGDVSGLGLMIGIEIVADKESKKTFDPKLNILQKIVSQAFEAGVWLRFSGSSHSPGDRIAFSPPLIITKGEVDKALDILLPILAEIKPG